MGLASHFGPWRLGTVPNTTGTTAGTIRNMGATIVAQKADIAYGTTSGTAFVIPAGATITGIAVYSSTAFTGTSPTIKVTIPIPNNRWQRGISPIENELCKVSGPLGPVEGSVELGKRWPKGKGLFLSNFSFLPCF